MSASGSATPTNTNRPPSSSSDPPTISRPHESSPTNQSLVGEREEISTELRSTPTHSPIQQPSSAGRRLTDSPPAVRMAKRLRKESPQTKHDSRSTPSSDSQGGMDDTEDLPMQTHHLENPPPATAPKKKRTRTLTTPAQSAVLHALLAKSRFPTTAVREEVGRTIGLSARKVQIWFQNQRQKARRPRNPDVRSPATQGPAQYGSFPSTSEQHTSFVQRGFPIESHVMGQALSSSEDVRFRTPGYTSESPVYASRSSEPHSRLLGPGMPGYETRAAPPLALSRRVSPPESPIAGPSRQPYETQYSDPYPSRHSDSPPRRFPGTRPTSSPSFSNLIDRESRTLPPLVFPPRSSLVPPAQRSAPAAMPPLIFHRSPSPEQPFAYGASQLSSSTGLPPPFTLQPPPQWDNSHFTTLPSSAHSSSSWSRPSSQSAHESSASPSPQRITHTIYEEIERDETAPSSSSSRGGRFDPIRTSPSSYPAAGPTSRTDREQRPSS